MTVLTLFNTDANIGGAGRAAYTLLKNIRDEEYRAKLYVKHSAVIDQDVRIIRTGYLRSKCQMIIDRHFIKWGYPDRFRFSTLELAGDPWIKRTDIFQLYNLHGEYFSLPFLPYIVQNKPVVWRMPDLWAVTGGCAYSYNCNKWLAGCGNCPVLDDYPSLKRDTTRWWFDMKKKTYSGLNITVVATSDWMRGIVKRSPLLGHCDVVRIFAGIDMRAFCRTEKNTARLKLGIPPDASVLLMSAGNLSSARKGYGIFAKSLEEICAKGPDNLHLLLVGEKPPEVLDNLPRPVKILGKIATEKEMALVYSAADIFVFPTRADNLPKAPIESLACGTPCVASNVGGIPEIIEHGGTGYLIDNDNHGEFVHSVLKLLYDEDLRKGMSRRCRNSVLTKFDVSSEVEAYRRLYESLLCRIIPVEPVKQSSGNSVFSMRQYAHSAI